MAQKNTGPTLLKPDHEGFGQVPLCYFPADFADVFFDADLADVDGLAAAFSSAAAFTASTFIRAAVAVLRLARVLLPLPTFILGFVVPIRLRARLVVMFRWISGKVRILSRGSFRLQGSGILRTRCAPVRCPIFFSDAPPRAAGRPESAVTDATIRPPFRITVPNLKKSFK